MLKLDHLVVTAPDLDKGCAVVEQALGVRLAPGGHHVQMGTWNRLLKLGAGLYLEVIAIDPEASAPDWPRWYALDARPTHVRLSHWAARTDDLDGALAAVPLALGQPMDFTRGALSWRMAVPADGCLPFGGAAPALIEWGTGGHPAEALPDAGCRLKHLTVSHPKIDALRAAFPDQVQVPHVRLEPGPFEIAARIDTPTGCWTLA